VDAFPGKPFGANGPHDPIAANKLNGLRWRCACPSLHDKIVLCKYKKIRPRNSFCPGSPVSAHHRAAPVPLRSLICQRALTGYSVRRDFQAGLHDPVQPGIFGWPRCQL